ncbi:MAG: hypothetical protein ACMG55_02385 [Microcoleus sp.]
MKGLSPKYYDVQIIMVQKPMALGFKTGEISQFKPDLGLFKNFPI